MKLSSPELTLLLDIANDFRKEKQAKLLKDLPESTPQVESACLVANAFSYDPDVNICTVLPDEDNVGGIYFSTKKDRELYCDIIERHTGERPKSADIPNKNLGRYIYRADLPEILNEVAVNFDAGEYEEYATEIHPWHTDF